MSSGSKIHNEKKSIESESGQAVSDATDELKKMENDLQDSIKSVFISDYPESPRPAVHRSPPDHRWNQLIREFWKNNTFLSVKSWSCFNVFGWVVSMKGRTFHWCARNYSAEGQDFRKTFLAFICICLLLKWILLERNLSWEPISFYLYFQHNLNSEINDTLCFHQKFLNFERLMNLSLLELVVLETFYRKGIVRV